MAHDISETSRGPHKGLRLLLLATGPMLIVGGLAGVDRLIAETVGHNLPGASILRSLVDIMDLATGKEITNFLLGALLILLAAGLNLWRRRRILSGNLMYVGLVQFLSTTIADLSKPLLGRPRPFQAMIDGRWSDLWFAGPDYGSFPSGHVAFYVGLFVPIVLLYPKRAWPLLLVLSLVGLQRMVSHDHYMTDVGASVLLGVATSLLLARWFDVGAGRRSAKARVQSDARLDLGMIGKGDD